VIARSGKPVARLVPIEVRREPRRLGQFAGQIRIAPDFDALPADLQAAFEGEEP
jgi:antitoxin (DNA-binding transcriptional repressor) of toxin-antitoxin stability system